SSSPAGRWPRNATVTWRCSRGTARTSCRHSRCQCSTASNTGSGRRRARKRRRRSSAPTLAGRVTRLRQGFVPAASEPGEALRPLDRVRLRDDAPEEDVARAGHRREPRRDEAARARLRGRERDPAFAAELQHVLLDRALVPAVEPAFEREEERLLERVGPLLD